MDRPLSHRGNFIYAGQLIALATAYVVLAMLGLRITPVSGFATLVWPPVGIGLAALLLGGYRLWPAIAIGAFAANLWTGAPPWVALGIALGNTLEGVIGTFALRRIAGFTPSLERFKDVVCLFVLAGMASTVISATIGVTSLSLGGLVAPGAFGRTWTAWWTGNLLGDFIVAPLLLTWAGAPRLRPRLAGLAETAALGALLAACAALVFLQSPVTAAESPIQRPYLLFLPMIWAALRFGVRGAATATFLVAVAAVSATAARHGPFVRADPTDSLFALYFFLLAAALASLLLGALTCELRDKAAMLRGVIDGTTDAVYLKDRLGRYVITNTAYARVLGVNAEAPNGQDDSAVFPAGEARALRERDQEVLQTGQPRTFEDSLTIAGKIRVYQSTRAPYRDRDGNVIGIIGISRDITERQHLEKALRQSEERLRLAVEAAHLGVWGWDLENDQLLWTPECKSMHGLGPDDEVTYQRFLALIHPDDRESSERAIQRAMDTCSELKVEHRIVWPDGSVHWISGSGRALCASVKTPCHMVGVSLDITAAKQADQERAALLLREQAARAEAQSATRAKDEFLAVLSHELRTPLHAILGWTEMLRAPDVDGHRIQKGLETIARNTKLQTQLIEDLLDVSRIVAGKLRLAHERVDLASIVASAVDSAKVAAHAKSLRLDATIEPLGRPVLGDPDRLQQILSNLLSNAVKFTPNRGAIRVLLRPEGKQATIVVEDTGRGISAELLPRVFDRFRQAESTTARSHSGLGLGLTIVRHLVELHGGTVTAESPGEGRGATLTVRLPLADGELHARPAVQKLNGANESHVLAALQAARVLVVDDDLDACELLETALQASGATVCAVHSARAAINAIVTFRPQVLMSDIGMPDEDGYALIRQVREREVAEGGHIPAVAVTAFASQADRELALALGFDAHLAKPVSPADLTRTVAALVKQAV